jgi:alanine racemase
LNFLNSYRIFKNNLKGYQPNYHLLRLEIDSQQLKNNIDFIKTKFNIPYLSAVLKSNAYGHGLKEIGKILDSDSQFFA